MGSESSPVIVCVRFWGLTGAAVHAGVNCTGRASLRFRLEEVDVGRGLSFLPRLCESSLNLRCFRGGSPSSGEVLGPIQLARLIVSPACKVGRRISVEVSIARVEVEQGVAMAMEAER